MRNLLTNIVIIHGILFCSKVTGQPNPYIYIQGDKSMPFYVKANDKMMPRYGKNYCILPGMKAGIVHLEILFEQNKLLPEQFDVRVPENGCRSLLLAKQKDHYILYDLQTNKYLDTVEK